MPGTAGALYCTRRLAAGRSENPPDMQTHFNSHTLAEIFRDLYLTERRGVLTLASDEVTCISGR